MTYGAGGGGGGGSSDVFVESGLTVTLAGNGHGTRLDGPLLVVQPRAVASGPYWPGWNIARGVAVLPDGSGGYVLDGWGGLYPLGLNGHPAAPQATNTPYWPRWDVARGTSAPLLSGVQASATPGEP